MIHKKSFCGSFSDEKPTSPEEMLEAVDEDEKAERVDFKDSTLSKDLEHEMAISMPRLKCEGDTFATERDEKREATTERANGCNDLFWWSSFSSRYELQNLPPPPKLISSVPRNGLSKVHHAHSSDQHSVITLNQRHHFPITANSFAVVNFHDHRVPSIPESIPVRASLDGLREVSLNLRHVSESHRDSSLCPSIPQSASAPPFNGNHFFIHSHPFLPSSHQQQECLTNLQNKDQNRKAGENDETKYKCEICNSSFTLQRLLNRHMKTHSFYKRYHCQYCTKGFNDTFDLKRHIRTHTGIKPFKCSRCDKSFTQRCSLEAHLTRVHGVVHKFGFRERRSKMFVCEDCGSTFTENSDFMKHLHEFHPETEKIMRARRNGGFAPKIKGDNWVRYDKDYWIIKIF